MVWLSLNFPDYIKFREKAAGACRASGGQFIRLYRNQSNWASVRSLSAGLAQNAKRWIYTGGQSSQTRSYEMAWV